MILKAKIRHILAATLVFLVPLTAMAGIDKPWNEADTDGVQVTLGSTLVVIAYFALLFRWPKHMFLLAGAIIIGGTVHSWFGETLGWLAGISLVIWGYKEFIHEKPSPPESP